MWNAERKKFQFSNRLLLKNSKNKQSVRIKNEPIVIRDQLIRRKILACCLAT